MSRAPPLNSTRSVPFVTTVISSNSGVCPGSSQPLGEIIRATLTSLWPELTRPANSWICFGLVPTQSILVGFSISLGMALLGKAYEPRLHHEGHKGHKDHKDFLLIVLCGLRDLRGLRGEPSAVTPFCDYCPPPPRCGGGGGILSDAKRGSACSCIASW